MKALLVLTLLCSSAALTQQQTTTVGSLAWIAGCWEQSKGNSVSQEQWMQPSGGTMMGMSRTVAGGKTVSYEHLMLKQEGKNIYYVSIPSGQQEAAFKLVKYTATEAVFENPEHDFPQRIIYRLKDDGSLHARIEGKMNGQEQGMDFPFKRVSCDKK